VRHIRVITETLLHRLMELTSRYDLTPEQQDDIPLASALHDIGKIGIDEAILNKPGRLTAEEFAVIKTHSMLGAEMLQKTESFADQPLLQTAYEIFSSHYHCKISCFSSLCTSSRHWISSGLNAPHAPFVINLDSSLVRERLFVAPLAGQCIVHIRHGDQLRTDGDIVPFQPVRVALAVPALVVPAGDLVGSLQKRLICKAFGLLQHLFKMVRGEKFRLKNQKPQQKTPPRPFLKVCAAAAAAGLTACGKTQEAAALPELTVGSDSYPPFVYLSNDSTPTGIDVDIATEAFARMGYAVQIEIIDWEQKTNLVESVAIDCIWGLLFHGRAGAAVPLGRAVYGQPSGGGGQCGQRH